MDQVDTVTRFKRVEELSHCLAQYRMPGCRRQFRQGRQDERAFVQMYGQQSR